MPQRSYSERIVRRTVLSRRPNIVNQFVQVVTHPTNNPCVHPTRVINRDLSHITNILQRFRREVFKPGFKPAFQVAGSNDPQRIIDGIRIRVSEPWEIDQGGASLCGPAAFMYCLAKDAPELYAQYVCELYTTGKASINERGRTKHSPNNKCLRLEFISGVKKKTSLTRAD
jgi:hypothetical protein